MTAAGYLLSVGGQYPVLKISDLGVAVLKGEQKVYRKVAIKATHVLPENDGLFERLRGLRRDFAKKQGVPPFVIFSDKTLHDMCAVMPQTDEEMLTVSGVGESKLQKYGGAFLTEIKTASEAHSDNDGVTAK